MLLVYQNGHRGKKGSIFVPLVVFGAVIVLISLLLVLTLKKERLEGFGEEPIGAKQVKLLNAYQTGEKYLYFVDESAKKAIKSSLPAAAGSGFIKTAACGKRNDANLWVSSAMSASCEPVKQSCEPSPSEAEQYFVELFEAEYDSYIDKFNINIKPPPPTYEIPTEYEPLKLDKSSGKPLLIGLAKEPIVVSLAEASTLRPVIEYKVKPSFSHEVGVDFLQQLPEISGDVNGLTGLEEGVVEEKLTELNKGKELQWALQSYEKVEHSPPCSYSIGAPGDCSYKCGEKCEKKCVDYCPDPDPVTGEPVCCKEEIECSDVYCEGTPVKTINYHDVFALFDISTGKSYPYYDASSKSVNDKEVAYKLGISWIEQKDCIQSCSGNEPKSC